MDFKKLLELIEQNDSIVLFHHIFPDPDTLGSCKAMGEWLKLNFPKKRIYYAYEEKPEVLNDLPVVMEYENPSIDVAKKSLGIIFDTPVTTRISNADLFQQCKLTIKIDHHVFYSEISDYSFSESTKSSTCEIVGDFFRNYEDKYAVSTEALEALFTGIVTDTNRFLNPNLTASTFEISAWILKHNIDFAKVYRNTYDSSANELKLKAYILKNINVKKRIASIFLPNEVIAKYEVPYHIAKENVYLLNNIKNVDFIVFCTYDDESQNYKISLRSNKIPINEIAKKYGGGGHKLACGVKTKSLEVFEQIKRDIEVL